MRRLLRDRTIWGRLARPRSILATGFLAALLVCPRELHAEAPRAVDAPGWVLPARARIVPLSVEATSTGAAVDVDPALPIELGPGKALLLPIEQGDRVRIEGPVTAVGLGAGVRDKPDVVTWMPLPEARHEANVEARIVDVPMWTAARFLVVRSDKPAKIRLYIGSLTRSAMPWHRLDEDVTGFLGEQGAAVPTTAIAEAGAKLRWIVAAKSALDGAPRESAFDFLSTRWLESSLFVRPLNEPFFVRREVTLGGGRDAQMVQLEPDVSPWRIVLATRGAIAADKAKITVNAPECDVVRLLVQARGLGVARARVKVGDFVVREMVWDVALRTADAERWTATQSLRVPVPVGRQSVSVEVIQGEIAVAAAGFRMRADALDLIRKKRDRAARLDALANGEKEPAAAAVLRLAGLADRTANAADAEACVERAMRPDVPAAVRAFVVAQSVRWAKTSEDAVRAAEQAYELAKALPTGTQGPLLRGVLEQLGASYAEPLPPPRVWERPMSEAAHEEDRTAIDALIASISPPQDGRRPLAAPVAERFAWLHGDLEPAATLARRTWVREAPWDTLDPPPGISMWNEIGAPVDSFGDPRCHVIGSRGLRWTVLREGREEISVLPPPAPATHTRILVLPEETVPLPEAPFFVDGIAATAHTGAGLGSTVAVSPGKHVFERPAGSVPIFARILRDGMAPCDSLRELTRWMRIRGAARFRIPDPGRATVARIVVFAQNAGPRKPRRVHVRVGERVYEAWIEGGATGAVEVPIPAEVSDFEVETEEETLLRASARMHPHPSPPPRIAPLGRLASPESIALLLARVRDATREIEQGSPATRDASRKKRALALDALGYPVLAALDRGEDPTVDPAEDPDAPPAQALVLPEGSPVAVPLGLVPKIPPLPLPKDLGPLERARRAEATGDGGAALRELTEGNARASTDADGLLYAVLTERSGAGFIAADVFERIGLIHRSGAALAHAASLSADRAAEDQDRARALRSFVLAQLAADNGDPASHAFARLAPAVGFLGVARADQSAGTGLVDVRGGRDPLPLGSQVRRALLDAPEDALLLSEGQHVMLRLKQSKPSSVGIEMSCLALESDPVCQLSVEVDGIPSPCGATGSSGQTSSRTACTIGVPRGDHRVEIRGPRGRTTIGSVRFSGGGGFSMQARVVSEWFEIDPDRPLELAFAAPTVVRLHTRGFGGAERRLEWSVDPSLKHPSGVSSGELILDPTVDPAANLVGGDPSTLVPLGKELEKRIAVLDEGAHTLHVTSRQGRSVVRVELAIPIGLPKPRRSPPPYKLSPAPILPAEGPIHVAPDITFDPDPGAYLLSLYARYRNLDVDDEDNLTGKSFVEIGLAARREIAPIDGYAGFQAFVRARFGAPSFGAAGSFDVAPHGLIPGFFARGRVVAQPFDEGFAIGLRGFFGALWSARVADSFSLVPWAGIGLVYVDSAIKAAYTDSVKNVRDDIDREIWTRYTDKRPDYGVIGLRGLVRPAIDALGSIGTSLRTTPDFAGVDRVDLTAQLHLLAGRGFSPWITLGTFASYRPSGYERPETFTRVGIEGQATFWSWILRGHRVSAGIDGRLFADIPRENSPFRLSAGIYVGYDFAGGRGLRDLPPRDAPFRARLEEGSGRIDRRQSPSDPTWGTPP